MILNIKTLRKEKKLSQIDLASKIDISVRMFAEYENETSDIPLKKLQKIADILEVSLFELINEKDFNKVAKDDNTHILHEPKHNYINPLQLLVDTQKELIEMQREKITDLERRLFKGKRGKENAS